MTATTPEQWLAARRLELALGFSLLTRLPVPRFISSVRSVGDFIWTFPLVGLAVGSLAAAACAVARQCGASASLAALLAVATSVLVTGALHEDGLADFCDGVGGGRTRERKLAIMRDSSIGSYGAVALVVGVALRWTALSDIGADGAAALVLTHVSARGMLAVIPEFWRPARRDGLAAAQGGSWLRSLLALLLTMTIAVGYAPAPAALVALIASAAATVSVAAIASRYLGGYTGDVLGAAEQFAEVLALCALSVLHSR